MQIRFRSGVLAVITTVFLVACAREDDGGVPHTASAAIDTAQSAMQGMQGMPGMQGPGGTGMMEQMQAHMRMMGDANADSMQAMLPLHRQMVANMISQFNREMREMDMMGDSRWDAIIDSLRQDNIRLPDMTTSELRVFMPEHHARVMRLMEMHRDMMSEMR